MAEIRITHPYQEYWIESRKPRWDAIIEQNDALLLKNKLENDFRARKAEYSVVGREDVYRFDGYAKASGQAEYTTDVLLPGMLYAKFLRSPYAHAKITSMDTSKAEALPGVKAVIRWDGPGGPSCSIGDEAFYHGAQIGALVCAETEELCREALRLIDVVWEELPFTLSAQEALEADFKTSDRSKEDNLHASGVINARGDVEAGFAEADQILDIDWSTPTIHHSTIEPWCTVVDWQGDPKTGHAEHCDARATSQGSGQWSGYAGYLGMGLPSARVTGKNFYMGGGFGQKYLGRGGTAWANTYLSKKFGRPVKMCLSREEDYSQLATDAGIENVHFKVGVNNDGFVTTVHVNNLIAEGQGGASCHPASGEAGTNSMGGGVDRGGVWGCLKSPNVLNEATAVYTNMQGQCWYRGSDHPVTGLNLVTHLVTEALNMDTEEFILKNVPEYEPGVNGVYSLTECIRQAKEGIGWDEKRHPPGEKKLPSGKYHGIGFRWMETFGGGTYGEAAGSDSGAERGLGQSVGITGESGGKFRLNQRLADVGVAPHSAYAMIVAEEMGAKIEDVSHPPAQSDDDQGFAPHEGGTAHGLGNTGPACMMAGREIKRICIMKGAFRLGVEPEECDTKDSTVYVKSDPEKSVKFSQLGGRPTIGCGEQFVPFIDPPNNWAMIATEVEVDPETGQVDLIKSVIVNDVGTMIRPKTVEGQMYGAHIFDIDCGLWSECIYDPLTGVRLNSNYLEYKIATILDAPPDIDTRPLEIGSGPGAYGSIGVGEDNHDRIIFSDAVYNAIGKWICTPITPAKVLKALGKV